MLPSRIVEFLIPVTIVATALENLIVRDRSTAIWGRRYRPVFAGVFGLVHGAGFANYLRSLFVDRIAVPLLGFNVGLEVGQLIVIALAFISFAIARSHDLGRDGGVAASQTSIEPCGSGRWRCRSS